MVPSEYVVATDPRRFTTFGVGCCCDRLVRLLELDTRAGESWLVRLLLRFDWSACLTWSCVGDDESNWRTRSCVLCAGEADNCAGDGATSVESRPGSVRNGEADWIEGGVVDLIGVEAVNRFTMASVVSLGAVSSESKSSAKGFNDILRPRVPAGELAISAATTSSSC